MNNTYKLFGTIWDGLQTTEDINYISIVNQKKDNIINISSLLKINNNDELENIINNYKILNDIIINIDYIPHDNKIINTFYIKRIKQIYKCLRDKLKIKIYLSDNIKEKIELQNNL